MCDSDCGEIEEIADGKEVKCKRNADGGAKYEHNGVKDQPRQRWVYMKQRRREIMNRKACRTRVKTAEEAPVVISVTQDREGPMVRIPLHPLSLHSASSHGPSTPQSLN